jgi:hypothetical protein
LERDDAVTNNEKVNIRDYDDFYIKFHDEFSLLNWLVSGMSLKDALINNVPDVKVTEKVESKEFGLNMNDLSDYMEVLASSELCATFKKCYEDNNVLAFIYLIYPELRLQMVLNPLYEFSDLLEDYKPVLAADVFLLSLLKEYDYRYGLLFDSELFLKGYQKFTYDIEKPPDRSDFLGMLIYSKKQDYDGIKLDRYRDEFCKKTYQATLDKKELRRSTQFKNHLDRAGVVSLMKHDTISFNYKDYDWKFWLGNRRGLEIMQGSKTFSYVLKRKDRISLKDLAVVIKTLGPDYSWIARALQLTLK